ncbi:TolC family protein [Nannocystis bainbridge]|uniref:TolC family protein n=1 Tax=Nannocystis bainbridge TaxID=2995303 RepID=A0ABT5DQC1_9BACT|nr:TolC family protein [Nannocystis bainbridge]MDC0715856.1 TolC family protein [Nannocystis bainbridge]
MSLFASLRATACFAMLYFGTGTNHAAAGPPVSDGTPPPHPAPTLDKPEPRELAPAPLRPGPTQRWTVDRVVRAVESKHPRMAALKAKRGVLDARVLTARTSMPNPYLLSDNGTAEYTYRLGFTQTFELGKRRRRVEVAGAQVGVHDADLRILAAELRAEARRTFMEAFFAQEREAQFIALIRSVDELLGQAEALPGDIPRADVLEASTTRLHARLALEQAKFEHLQADIRLNSLLGNAPSVELVLISPARDRPPSWLELDNDDWRNEFLAAYDHLIVEALRRRPELARLKSTREVVNKEERLARANRAPDMVVSAGPDMVPQGKPMWGAFFMLSLEVPLFNRQQGPMAEVRATREQIDSEGAALAHEIARQLADAVALASFQQSQLRLYEGELLPAADAVYEDARQAFLANQSPFLVAVRAQEGRVLVYLAYFRALAAYHVALAGVEQALGFPAI